MQPLTLGGKHNKTNILESTANQNVMILYHITPISSSTSHSQILCLAKEMTHLAKLHHCLLINPRNYLLLAASFSRLKRKKKKTERNSTQAPASKSQSTCRAFHTARTSWTQPCSVSMIKWSGWHKTCSSLGKEEAGWECNPASNSEHFRDWISASAPQLNNILRNPKSTSAVPVLDVSRLFQVWHG